MVGAAIASAERAALVIVLCPTTVEDILCRVATAHPTGTWATEHRVTARPTEMWDMERPATVHPATERRVTASLMGRRATAGATTGAATMVVIESQVAF
jgi:hypothetical protein